METPYFILDEKSLIENIMRFKEALEKNWSNSKIAYSIKTNSLPWLLKYMCSNDIFAEAVSQEEYDLAVLCGYNASRIVFNGPIKTEKQFEMAVLNGSIVNIDSQGEIDFLKKKKPVIKGYLGIRVNIDPKIFHDEDVEYSEDGFRFGFADKDGHLENVINDLEKIYGHRNFGLHLHCNTVTRSVDAYQAISKYATELIVKYNLKPKYIDIGGGFFGGVPGKPAADDYISAIRQIFDSVIDVNDTMLIIEPGSALSGSIFDFYTSVLDVKDTLKSRIVTTDGSRINIDPLWIKSRYQYDIINLSKNKIIEDQIICGYTCMDHDRIMRIKNQQELMPGDRIVYHKVGNYTTTFGGMFIRYYPEIYVKKTSGEIEMIRHRTSVEEYYNIHN